MFRWPDWNQSEKCAVWAQGPWHQLCFSPDRFAHLSVLLKSPFQIIQPSTCRKCFPNHPENFFWSENLRGASGEHFWKWLEVIYLNKSLTVIYLENVRKPGCKTMGQRYPLSSMLLSLIIEPLVQKIRDGGRDYRCRSVLGVVKSSFILCRYHYTLMRYIN